MAIEVCNPYGESWRVYFSENPHEVAEKPLWGEYVVTWATHYYPDAEQRAHKYGLALRSPGGYERILKHWNILTYNPLLVRECGCHEDAEHYWIPDPDCLHEKVAP